MIILYCMQTLTPYINDTRPSNQPINNGFRIWRQDAIPLMKSIHSLLERWRTGWSEFHAFTHNWLFKCRVDNHEYIYWIIPSCKNIVQYSRVHTVLSRSYGILVFSILWSNIQFLIFGDISCVDGFPGMEWMHFWWIILELLVWVKYVLT